MEQYVKGLCAACHLLQVFTRNNPPFFFQERISHFQIGYPE